MHQQIEKTSEVEKRHEMKNNIIIGKKQYQYWRKAPNPRKRQHIGKMIQIF